MTELLVVIVIGLVVIAAAAVVGPRLGIASPLVLAAIGVAARFLPVFASVHIEPEWILAGVLPPRRAEPPSAISTGSPGGSRGRLRTSTTSSASGSAGVRTQLLSGPVRGAR